MKKFVKIGSAALTVLGMVAAPSLPTYIGAKVPIKIRTACDPDGVEARPKTISFACADDNYGATDIVWQYWGRKNAIGTGRVYVNPCEPTCVEDGQDVYSAQVVATRVRKGRFTKVVIIYNGKRPDRRSTEVIDQS